MSGRIGFLEVLKTPGALAPLALSAAAFALIAVVTTTQVGVSPDGDEGAPAHLFQLLVLLQVPIIVWFAVSWLPKRPAAAGIILGLQVLAVAAAVWTIVVLETQNGV